LHGGASFFSLRWVISDVCRVSGVGLLPSFLRMNGAVPYIEYFDTGCYRGSCLAFVRSDPTPWILSDPRFIQPHASVRGDVLD
jgi:hypothetical protein